MFKAKWCRACQNMKVFMKRYSKKYGDDIAFGGVDYNYNPGTCRNQGVKSLPYFRIYKNGEPQFTISGMKKREIEDELKKF